MKLKKAYIYPITNRDKKGVLNPYLSNFMAAFEDQLSFLNKSKPSDIGILNLLKYIPKIPDVIFLNWIEDLPDKKLGKLQCYLFIYFMVPILHLLGTKVVWTLHNKLSHYAINLKQKEWLFNKLTTQSDYILTHASDGIDFINKHNPKAKEKVIFMHHPLNDLRLPGNSHNKNIDLLIWGTVIPYKGILEFLEIYSKNDAFKNFKLVVAGRVPNEEYKQKILAFASKHIVFITDFIPFEELNQMIYSSKFILFTYKNNSVLSSGALMDSLITGTQILGPETGAFKDLANVGLVETYDSIESIEQKLKKYTNKDNVNLLKQFYEENNWKSFGNKLIKQLQI